MDIYDSRYFSFSKNLLIALGLWPYDTNRRYFIRIFFLMLLIIVVIPQVIGIIVNKSDWNRLIVSIFFAIDGSIMFLKISSFILAEKKMTVMFDGMAQTWQLIVDENENKILREYSEKGRTLIIIGFFYYVVTGCFFASAPLTIVIWNKLHPESEPIPYIYITGGEFLLENNDDHYFKIYFLDLLFMIIDVLCLSATDGAYAVCIFHCLGLFAILRDRVKKHGQMINDSSSELTDANYEWMIETIKLHQRIIRCTETLEESYSASFFCTAGAVVAVLPLMANIILVNLDDPILVVRFSLPFIAIEVLFFIICYPGQLLIDYSTNLFQDAYCNSWYESSARSNKLLTLFMLRCSVPCTITAGGLVTMNLETFYAVIKTGISYITVLASVR